MRRGHEYPTGRGLPAARQPIDYPTDCPAADSPDAEYGTGERFATHGAPSGEAVTRRYRFVRKAGEWVVEFRTPGDLPRVPGG